MLLFQREKNKNSVDLLLLNICFSTSKKKDGLIRGRNNAFRIFLILNELTMSGNAVDRAHRLVI